MSEPRHTMFAQRALSLAEMFQTTFGQTPVGQGVQYRPELSAPDGLSTGGGKQALQAVKLAPVQTGTTLVIGHANQVEGTAELRTYEYMVRMQQQRFKGQGELALERAAYDELLAKLKAFFSGQGMRVNVVASPTPSGQIPAASSGPGSSNMPIIIAGIVVGVLVLVGLIFFLKS